MNRHEQLQSLHTLLGQVLGEQPMTKSISIYDYPAHAVGVLAACASDANRARADMRMQALRAELQRVAKQIEGIEDTNSEMIDVEIFETSDLTAQPAIEREVEPQAVETALGTSGIASPIGGLEGQIAFLMARQKELSDTMLALKQQMDTQAPKPGDEDAGKGTPQAAGKQKPDSRASESGGLSTTPGADTQDADAAKGTKAKDSSSKERMRKPAQKSDDGDAEQAWAKDMSAESVNLEGEPYWGADPVE